MRKLLQFVLTICLLAGAVESRAQLAPGATAPDFTLTDLDGNQHTLYEYLDAGQVVFLDMFAVWCGPCLAYAPTVEEAYCQFGDIGNGSCTFLALEADDATNDALTNNNSIADWNSLIQYPLINQTGAVPGQYNLAFYPTIFIIRPDRTIAWASQDGIAINPGGVDAIGDILKAETEAAGMNNLRGWALQGDLSDCHAEYCGNLASGVEVQNMGTNEVTSFDATLNVGGTDVETVSWTGSIASLGTATVQFAAYSNTDPLETTVTITNVNGAADSDPSNNILTKEVAAAEMVETMDLTVELMTDGYGDETYWAILDGAGSIVAEGGNPNVGLTNYGVLMYPPASHPDMYGNNETHSFTVTVPASGCYSAVVTDYYGDGMCCNYGNGYFRVSDDQGNMLLNTGDFTGIDSKGMDISTSLVAAPNADFSFSQEDNIVTVTDNSDNGETWSWDFGDGSASIDGQDPGPYTYTENGTYTICVTVTNSAGTSTDCEDVIIDFFVGIEGFEVNSIVVKPNPASNFLVVQLGTNSSEVISVDIMNLQGQLVQNVANNVSDLSSEITADVSNIASGIYMITVTTETGVYAQKLQIVD